MTLDQLMLPVHTPKGSTIICAYCSRGPADGAALKRLQFGTKVLWYCRGRRSARECR